jgi:predicted ATP-dependent endonuclease of OLD family
LILKSITPINFGPFSAAGQTLTVDPEVTVLTGANDTGKSSLLRMIHLVFTEGVAEERDYNRYRIDEASGSWTTDIELKCVMEFNYKQTFNIGNRNLRDNDRIEVSVTLAPQTRGGSILSYTRNNTKTQFGAPIAKFPTSILFPTTHEVGERIDLRNMNPAEDQFIRLGFGAAFSFEKYKSLSEDTRADYVHESQLSLNEKLDEILPPSLPLQFKLRRGEPDKLEILRVIVVDSHRGSTPLGSRGAGVRKIASLMGTLLFSAISDKFVCILLDEPETALHADAQHALRRVLEGLAMRPNIQVIYATHSSSMVNTFRPSSIRVLKRDRIEEKATSIIINDAFDKNFLTVRSSLGLNPADSLLYAPITIVVEGPTEVRCIPRILEKFKLAGIEGFQDFEEILSQSHFLEGGGDSFEYLCRLAKSQGAKPVIFLDGDKSKGSSSRLMKKVREDHKDVPVVMLPEGEEFEQIVPAERYIEAIAMDLEDVSGRMTTADFDEWKVKQPHYERKAYSKLVEEWIRVEFDERLNKPRVMQKAVEITEAVNILPDRFRDLLAEMRKLGNLL